MYGWDTLVLLKHYLESGLSKTAIARQLGVSRRVIYHWITTGQLDRQVSETAAPAAPCGPWHEARPLPAADRAATRDLPRAVGDPPARGTLSGTQPSGERLNARRQVKQTYGIRYRADMGTCSGLTDRA